MNATKLAMALGMATALAAANAQAGTINIILSDADVVYSGALTSLYDAAGIAGDALNPTQADELETAVFEFDGAPVAVRMSSPADRLSFDYLVSNFPSTLTKNVYSVGVGNAGGGFGLDFFSASGLRLDLGIGSIDTIISNGVFFFTANATVLTQNLPAGLQFTDPNVVISFTATLPAVQAGSTTNMAIASGAVTISGTGIVPEPATGLLATLAAAAGIAPRRRR